MRSNQNPTSDQVIDINFGDIDDTHSSSSDTGKKTVEENLGILLQNFTATNLQKLFALPANVWTKNLFDYKINHNGKTKNLIAHICNDETLREIFANFIEEHAEQIKNPEINNLKQAKDYFFDAIEKYEGLATVELLLKMGMDPNLKQFGPFSTPLLFAMTKCDDLEIVKLLLKNGADCNLTNSTNDLPLHFAVYNLKEEFVKELLNLPQQSKTLDALNDDGFSPFMIAASKDCENNQILESFLEKNPNFKLLSKENKTVLHLALENATSTKALLLLPYCDKEILNTKDNEGNTPLLIAAQNGHEDVITELLSKDIDLLAVNAKNMNALDLASHKGQNRVVRQLLETGRFNEAQKNVAFSHAITQGHAKTVRLFLEQNAIIKKDLLNAAALRPEILYMLQLKLNPNKKILINCLSEAIKYNYLELLDFILTHYTEALKDETIKNQIENLYHIAFSKDEYKLENILIQHGIESTIKTKLNVTSLSELGKKYYEQKKYDEAILIYSHALLFDPSDKTKIDLHLNIGTVYFRQNNLVKAIQHYTQALNLEPDNEYKKILYNNRALCYRYNNQLDYAISDYLAALELNLDHKTKIHLYNKVGNIFNENKKFAEAISCFTQALILNPNDIPTLYNLAVSYESQAKFDESKFNYRRVIELCEKQIPVNQCTEYLDAKRALESRLRYDTTNLESVTDDFLAATINFSTTQYTNNSNLNFPKNSFYFVATKPGYSPIGYFGTCHWLVGVDIHDRFVANGVLSKIISDYEIISTEIIYEIDSEFSTELLNNGATLFMLDQMCANEAAEQSKRLIPLENEKIREFCESRANPLAEIMQEYENNLETQVQDSKNYLTNITEITIREPDCSKREIFWIETSILPLSTEGKKSLHVVGADHPPYLAAYCKYQGYTIFDAMPRAPLPQTEITRALFYGDYDLFFPNKFISASYKYAHPILEEHIHNQVIKFSHRFFAAKRITQQEHERNQDENNSQTLAIKKTG